MNNVVDLEEWMEKKHGRSEYVIQCQACGFMTKISLINNYHKIPDIPCPGCDLDGELHEVE